MRVEAVGAICDGDLWDSYVASKAEGQLYHNYAWRSVIEDVFGRRCHYLAARDDGGRICGVLPLVHLKSWMFGNYLISLPYFNYGGVLADSSDVRVDLLDSASTLAREHGAHHVELRHLNDEFPDLPKRVDKVSLILALPADEESLWRGFGGKLRAQIKRPLQEGATADHGGVELSGDFYGVFSRNMRDLGTPVYPARFFETIAQRFPDQSRFFVVRMGGEPVASALVLVHRQRLEIPWASSLRTANRYGVNMLLYWTALRWAVSQGHSLFDFGRSTVESGTYRFKRQWGAEPVQLYWHYLLAGASELPRINPDNPRYQMLVRIWQRQPLFLANFIGPHVVKYLP